MKKPHTLCQHSHKVNQNTTQEPSSPIDCQNSKSQPVPEEHDSMNQYGGLYVNRENYRLYTNGSHRRPSDPVTGEEAEKMLDYLFDVYTIKRMNEVILYNVLHGLYEFPKKSEVDAKAFMIDFNDILGVSNDAVYENLNDVSLQRSSIRAGVVAVEPQDDHSLNFAINAAIRNNQELPEFRRFLSIEIDNPHPVQKNMIDEQFYSTTYIVRVDMTRTQFPMLEDIRFKYGGALTNLSSHKPLGLTQIISDRDRHVMVEIAKSLLPDDILRFKYSKFEVVDPNAMEEGGICRSFQPYRHLGDDSTFGFDNVNDYASSLFVSVNSTFANDGKYNYTAAHNRFNPLPVTAIVTRQRTKHKKFSNFTHPREQSSMLCFAFFGRALNIEMSDVYDENGELLNSHCLRRMFHTKCTAAWKDDVLSDTVTSPLQLFDDKGFLRFTNIEGISYVQDDFIPEARGQASMDNNPAVAKPPVRCGVRTPQPQTQDVVQHSPDGMNIKMDGYNVQWGNWSFNLSFDIVRGVEISAVEYKYPDTEEGKKSQFIRYANLIAIPHLYTIYTAIDGQSAANFDDTGFYGTGKYIQNIIHGQDCVGDMINVPVYKCWNQIKADRDKKVGASNTWKLDERGNFYPRDNLSVPITDSSKQQKFFAYENMRGWANGICIQEKDSGVIMKHHNVIKRGKHLHVTSHYTMNFYSYRITYEFTEDGVINVEVGASGLPLTANPYGITNGMTPEGADTSSINHKHVYTVCVEPAVNSQDSQITNVVECVDKMRPGEVGVEVRSLRKQLRTIKDVNENNQYDWVKGRSWYLSSYDNDHNFRGALCVRSPGFTYLIDSKERRMKATYSDGYYPLTATMWVTPYSSDSTTLYQCGRGQVINRRLNDFTTFHNYPNSETESLYKDHQRVRTYFNIALDHVVIKEDLPTQRMITETLTLKPTNLFKMNPLCLMDYNHNNTFRRDRGFQEH